MILTFNFKKKFEYWPESFYPHAGDLAFKSLKHPGLRNVVQNINLCHFIDNYFLLLFQFYQGSFFFGVKPPILLLKKLVQVSFFAFFITKAQGHTSQQNYV